MEELVAQNYELESHIRELEGLLSEQSSDNAEFVLLEERLPLFWKTVDDMSVGERRDAVRSLVCKVIWDGADAHLLLYGGDEDALGFVDRTGE